VSNLAEEAEVLATWEAVARHAIDGRAIDSMVAVPVPSTHGGLAGRLLALPLDSPLDEFDRVAIEHAVPVVALGLMRTRQDGELVFRERGKFLVDVAGGRIEPATARHHAETLGFGASGSFLVPVVTSLSSAHQVPVGDEDGRAAAKWAVAAWETADRLRALEMPTLLGLGRARTEMLLVIAVHDPADRMCAADQAADAIHGSVRRHFGISYRARVAVGGVCRWANLSEGLSDAAESAAMAPHVLGAPWHDASRINVDRLLWHWRDDVALAAFVRRTLGPLIDRDRRRKLHLLPTLEALCLHGGHKADTARELHLGRTALYARLRRIERALDVDLDDSDTLFLLRLALHAHHQMDEATPRGDAIGPSSSREELARPALARRRHPLSRVP
jgi:purine catabolism regulator